MKTMVELTEIEYTEAWKEYQDNLNKAEASRIYFLSVAGRLMELYMNNNIDVLKKLKEG
jgi:hypothetical protein